MIGIIGAMDEEVAALKEKMEVEKVTDRASMQFVAGKLEGKEVTVVRSGIGKVNAAVCAQILASEFHVDTLINTGIAGSLDAKIDIGDMVISTDALHHDMDATAFGYPLGEVPRMDILAFPADEKLIRLAVEANEEANPDIHTFTGRVVSGDQFVASDEVKEKIRSNFGGLCTEMEGAAIAHTAYLNDISVCLFVLFRTRQMAVPLRTIRPLRRKQLPTVYDLWRN